MTTNEDKDLKITSLNTALNLVALPAANRFRTDMDGVPVTRAVSRQLKDEWWTLIDPHSSCLRGHLSFFTDLTPLGPTITGAYNFSSISQLSPWLCRPQLSRLPAMSEDCDSHHPQQGQLFVFVVAVSVVAASFIHQMLRAPSTRSSRQGQNSIGSYL